MGAIEEFKAFGAMTVRPAEMGVEAARRIEWLLSNRLGGYSSSTVLGLNTRKYHGLLVSSQGNLERRVIVESLAEEITAGKDVYQMAVNEYSGRLDSNSASYVKRFSRAKDHVKFEYDVMGTSVVKIVHAVRGRNAVIVSYGIRNNFGSPITFKVRPLVNSRSIHGLGAETALFRGKAHEGGILGCDLGKDAVYFRGEDMTSQADETWYRDMRYSMEAERGENAQEDVYSPGCLEMKVAGFGKANAEVAVALVEGGIEPADALAGLDEPPYTPYEPNPLKILEDAADSFVVRTEYGTTIIAGYHWFADWGRDTMISLPGLTLIHGRFSDAELIFSRFIDNMRGGRIPTRIDTGGPQYYDYDGTLWMIDRLKEYVRHAGVEAGAAFIGSRWGKIKGVVDAYSQMLENGLIIHKGGTWMDTIERTGAIEVQALWYNALNVIEGLSDLVGDTVDYGKLKSDLESSFMDAYWNGTHFNDCVGDGSLRPNQVIAASLDYSPMPLKETAMMLKVVDEELLTPCGLRTLDRKNPRYAPKYVGGVGEREKAYHNGTVWPWLLGPYAKCTAKVGGDKGRRYASDILKPVMNRLYDGCIGTLAEVYDAEPPHTARGAASQAWSVAEILRAYDEDAQAPRR